MMGITRWNAIGIGVRVYANDAELFRWAWNLVHYRIFLSIMIFASCFFFTFLPAPLHLSQVGPFMQKLMGKVMGGGLGGMMGGMPGMGGMGGMPDFGGGGGWGAGDGNDGDDIPDLDGDEMPDLVD